jgi:hypothetical protein
MSKSKMKPIIFSAPMIRAILGSRKTMTRRVMKPQPIMDDSGMWHWKDCQWMDGGLGFPASGIDDYAPYKPGSTMWVRETWTTPEYSGVFPDWDLDEYPGPYDYWYKADVVERGKEYVASLRWRPSIFMPREAARIFLRVTDVHAERLQDITEEDTVTEGVGDPYDYQHPSYYDTPQMQDVLYHRAAFAGLWDRLNAKRGYGWDADPWVWVYEFERITECCRCGKIGDCNDGLCEQCEFELMLELMQEEEPYE